MIFLLSQFYLLFSISYYFEMYMGGAFLERKFNISLFHVNRYPLQLNSTWQFQGFSSGLCKLCFTQVTCMLPIFSYTALLIKGMVKLIHLSVTAF